MRCRKMSFVYALIKSLAAEATVVISYFTLELVFRRTVTEIGWFGGDPAILIHYFNWAFVILAFAPIIYLFWTAVRNEYDRYEYY